MEYVQLHPSVNDCCLRNNNRLICPAPRLRPSLSDTVWLLFTQGGSKLSRYMCVVYVGNVVMENVRKGCRSRKKVKVLPEPRWPTGQC